MIPVVCGGGGPLLGANSGVKSFQGKLASEEGQMQMQIFSALAGKL
jgi:hypothetical protein